MGTGSCEEIVFSCEHEDGTGYLKYFVLLTSLASTQFLSPPLNDSRLAVLAGSALG